MIQQRKNLIVVTCCLLILTLGNAACLNLAGDCGNEIVRVVKSPANKLKAVVFQRDCGATTGFSTQVSILPADSKLPDEGGNIYTSDTDHGKSPTGPGGGPPVEVEWVGENSLRITYDKRARVFLRESSYKGVSIVYSEKVF